MRFPRGSYFDEDDDSGADSLDAAAPFCHYRHGSRGYRRGVREPLWAGSPPSNAMVPYDGHYQAYCGYRQSHCASPSPSTALQLAPSFEERLIQLEGDKDSLHMQVKVCNFLRITLTARWGKDSWP